MQVSKAAKACLEYHRGYSKENTIKAYEMILTKFCGPRASLQSKVSIIS